MKTITGTFQKPDGSAVASGKLYLQLSQDATLVGTAQIAPTKLTFALDSSGTLGAGVSVLANDELSPSGTAYALTVRDTNDLLVYGPETVSIAGSSPINLNSALTASNGVTYTSAVLTSPSAAQTIANYDLKPGSDLSQFLGDSSHRWSGYLGTATTRNFNNIRVATEFPGADIGAMINAAYADLPSSGGIIYVPQKADGTKYDFTTPITFTTVGKHVKLVALGCPSVTTGNVVQGVVLNYTPTTATSAITIDYTPADGGGYRGGHGLENIYLTNGTTYTNGGSGSSAVGIKIGPTNGGAHRAMFSNILMAGFGTGIYYPGSNNVGWGITCLNCNFAWNNTGVKYDIDRENDAYLGCVFAVNGIGLDLNHFGTEVTLQGGSIDSNTTSGVKLANGAILHAVGVHWENFGGSTAHYVDGGATASSSLDICGGYAYDDVTTGTTDYWFKAGQICTSNLFIQSNGRTISGGTLFTHNTRGKYDFFNVNTNLTNAMIYTAPVLAIDSRNSVIESQRHDFGEAAAPTGATGKDLLWGDSTAHRLKMNNNNGTADIVVGAATTDTFTNKSFSDSIPLQSSNAAQWTRGQASELLTLSTGGATTDTAANLLPANSIIEAVVARVTTTITTATDWKLGDATQAARFTAAQSGGQLTAGATVVGLNHADPTVATANLGPVQSAAAKVRVTTTGTPGAGAIRITVFYRQFVAPTS